MLVWAPLTCLASIVTERGVRLDTTGAFYRAESAISRDFAVLAAAVHAGADGAEDVGRPTRALRVLDAFGGCGSRSARYLERGVARFVHCNEGSDELGALIRANLAPYGTEGDTWAVSHVDAHALLLRNVGEYAFDLIDADSFGLSARALSAAMWSVKLGGLLYATQTDGRARVQLLVRSRGGGSRPTASSSSRSRSRARLLSHEV